MILHRLVITYKGFVFFAYMNKYEDLIIKETTLKHNIKYWICENPFSSSNLNIIEDYVNKIPYEFEKNVYKNPISVNMSENELNNIPFINDLSIFMLNFFKKTFESKYRPIIKEYKLKPSITYWINKYSDKVHKTSNKNVFIPHIDGKLGIVANLWLSKDLSSSCTKLFKYDGKITVNEIEDIDGTVMRDKVKFNFSNHMDKMNKNRNEIVSYTSWSNLDNHEFENHGFEYLGGVPSIYSHMSIYEINTPHIPYIPPEVSERNALAIVLCF